MAITMAAHCLYAHDACQYSQIVCKTYGTVRAAASLAASYAAWPAPCHLVLPFKVLVVTKLMMLVLTFLTVTLTVMVEVKSLVVTSVVKSELDFSEQTHNNKQVSSCQQLLLCSRSCHAGRRPHHAARNARTRNAASMNCSA